MVLGGSAFNVKAKSLRLGDFSEQEVRELLGQHTAATGQGFTEEAVRLIVARTAGQPWLVNALCREACFDDKAGRDRSRPIAEHAVLEAQERLILARVTHLDRVAAGRARAAVRGGVQGAARRAGADRRGRDAADPRLRGPVRGGGGPPDRVRPRAGAELGGEDLPPPTVRRRRAGHGLGHVTPADEVRPGSDVRARRARPPVATGAESGHSGAVAARTRQKARVRRRSIRR